MSEKSRPLNTTRLPRVFTPTTTRELLGIYRRHPDALIWAGGTALLREHREKRPLLPLDIINLTKVKELSKISRTERYLEIGAGTPINNITHVGKNLLPPVLAQALQAIGPPAIRNMATLGGNLCYPHFRLNGFTVLILMNVQVEIRSADNNRWIQLHRLYNRLGDIALEQGEILTRVRIPLEEWNIQFFKKIGDPILKPDRSISFCALANIEKATITDFRFAVGSLPFHVIRNREMESIIEGNKIPLTRREIRACLTLLESTIETRPKPISLFQRERIRQVVEWFFSERLVEDQE